MTLVTCPRADRRWYESWLHGKYSFSRWVRLASGDVAAEIKVHERSAVRGAEDLFSFVTVSLAADTDVKLYRNASAKHREVMVSNAPAAGPPPPACACDPLPSWFFVLFSRLPVELFGILCRSMAISLE